MKSKLLLFVIAAVLTTALVGVPSASATTMPSGLTSDQQLAWSEATSGAYLGSGTNTISNTANTYAVAGQCYLETATESFGTWPYEQNVHLHTNWCGTGPASSGGHITYWSAYTTTTSQICSANDTYKQKMYGGVGSTYVAIEGGSYFSCQVAPLWSVHHHTYVQMKYGPGGGIFILGGG